MVLFGIEKNLRLYIKNTYMCTRTNECMYTMCGSLRRSKVLEPRELEL